MEYFSRLSYCVYSDSEPKPEKNYVVTFECKQTNILAPVWSYIAEINSFCAV